jgi:hypothetical protein
VTRRLRPYDWLARVDGIGHAQVRGERRALCGDRAVDAQYAHPVTTRHDACVAAAEQYEERRRRWPQTQS